MLNSIHKISDAFKKIEEASLVIILGSMIVLAVAQILMRNVLEGGFSWIDPLVRIGVLWIAMIGAMVGTRMGGHISVDILAHYVPEKWQAILIRITAIISAFICGLMSWVSVRFIIDEMEYGMAAFGNVPSWPFEIIIPIGFSIMTLRFIATFITANPGSDS